MKWLAHVRRLMHRMALGLQATQPLPVFPFTLSRFLEPHPIKDFLAIWNLYRLIKRFRPTIVHIQTSKAGVVGRLATRLAGTSIVIHTAHAFPFHSHLPLAVRWRYVVIERWMARLTDLIIVDTESVRSDGLREHVVNAREKLVTVPMGLDPQKFSPSKLGPGNSHAGFRFNTALGIALTSSMLGAMSHLRGAMWTRLWCGMNQPDSECGEMVRSV